MNSASLVLMARKVETNVVRIFFREGSEVDLIAGITVLVAIGDTYSRAGKAVVLSILVIEYFVVWGNALTT